jgi:hypothetical protein
VKLGRRVLKAEITSGGLEGTERMKRRQPAHCRSVAERGSAAT